MSPENSIKEGGAHSRLKINRLEHQGGMLTGKVMERGGGSGPDSELQRISLPELFRTMQMTTSETELGKLRQEKARRWQEVSNQLGDNMNQVRQGIETIEKTIESGNKPGAGNDAPDVAQRIAEASGLDNDKKIMLEVVMKDEIRAKIVASGKAPDSLREDLDKQDRRHRVTDISGIPIYEGKSSGKGGQGVEIKLKQPAEISEEEKIGRAVKEGVLEAEREKRRQEAEAAAKRTFEDMIKDPEQLRKAIQTVTSMVAVGGLATEEIGELGKEVLNQIKTGKKVDLNGAVAEVKGRREKFPEPETEKPEEKPKPKESEPKFKNFREAYDYIKQNWRSYEVLKPEEKAIFDEAMRLKSASVEAVSRHGNNEYGQDKGLFDDTKQGVRAVMSRLVGDDNYWSEVQASGLPRQDVINKMARDLEPIRNMTPDGKDTAEGVRDAWFEGVVRQWRLAELRAEDKRGVPGNRKDRIDELEKEQKFLGWGSVSTPETLLLMDQLADRAVSWRIQNDPALKSWAEAESKKNKPGEEQVEQVLSPEEMVKRVREQLRVTENSLFQSANVMERINNLKAIANQENVDKALRDEIMDRLSVWMAGSEVMSSKAKPTEIIGKVTSLRQIYGLAVNEMVVERLLNLDNRGIKVGQAWNLLQEVHNPAKYSELCMRLGIKEPATNLYSENATNQAEIRRWMLKQLVGDRATQEQIELAGDALRIAENLAKSTGETSVWNKAATIGEDKMAKWMYMKEWKIAGGIRKRGPDVIKTSLEGYGTSWIRDSMGVSNDGMLSAEDILGSDAKGEKYVEKLKANGFEKFWVKATRQDAVFDLLTKTTWEKKEFTEENLSLILFYFKTVDPNGEKRLKNGWVMGVLGQISSAWGPKDQDLGWTPGDLRNLEVLITETRLKSLKQQNDGQFVEDEKKSGLFIDKETWNRITESLKSVGVDPKEELYRANSYRKMMEARKKNPDIIGSTLSKAGSEFWKHLWNSFK